MKKAVVCFSGGQDSTTCLFHAMKNYDEVHAVIFDYNQRHRKEIEVAKDICSDLNIKYKIIDATFINTLSPSYLTRDIALETNEGEIPNAFVTGRNIFFLSIVGVYAKLNNIQNIIIGVCDFSRYPDCRASFVRAINLALSIGLDSNIHIHTPLMFINKSETWKMAHDLKCFDFIRSRTLTCYNGVIGDGCGSCPPCNLRREGLEKFISGKLR